MIGVSAAVVVAGATVAPQAFAGTFPGFGGGANRPAAGFGLRAGGGDDAAAGSGERGFGRLGAGQDDGQGQGQGLGLGGRGLGGQGLGGQGLGGRGLGGGGLGGQGLGGQGQDDQGQDDQGQDDGQGQASSCPDVELVFARGTGEPQGLGIVGRPLAEALAAEMPDRTVGSFAVVYAAAANQASSGPGATNMTQRITSVAQQCADTQFVIGGYSQGASVTDIAIGIRGAGTPGDAIPDELASRVSAVVVFGNPLGLRRQTIAQNSETFGPKAREFCANGDPVCGGGANFAAHLAYPRNGNIQEAAEFAAGRIEGS